MKRILLLAVILVLGFYTVAPASEVLIFWDVPPAGSSYEQYDIVQVQLDDSYWGGVDPRRNASSQFIIVQLTGLSIEDFTQYFQPLWDMTDPESPIMIKKRQFKFDRKKIPQNIVNYINNNNGFVVVSESQWNSYITNKEGQL